MLALNFDNRLVYGIFLRFLYLLIGFLNIKLFLNSFSSYEYGKYSWIISTIFISTIIGFMGGQSEIFRRLTKKDSLSSIHISFISIFMTAIGVIFILVANNLHQVNMYHLALYLTLIILLKLITLYFRAISKPIIIDFLNVGIIPISLFISFFLYSNSFESLISFHLLVAYSILIFIIIFSSIYSFIMGIDFSNSINFGKESIFNSLAFYSTSLSSIVFNTMDIFILGFFYSLDVVASYSFATRICAGIIYPLNFLIAKYQPLIVGQKKFSQKELLYNKFYAVVFMLLCMLIIIYLNDILLILFPEVASNAWIINIFIIMYIIRVLFFDINCEVQFIYNINGYAKVNIVNLIVGIPLLFLIAKSSNLFLFCILVFTIQMVPMFYSILFKILNSQRWHNQQ